MNKINVSNFSELVHKKILNKNNEWYIESYIENKSMANVYIIKKNNDPKEYIIKLENKDSGSLFCEFHFYIRITKLLPKNINILPMIDFGFDITVNSIKQRNIIIEKKKYCFADYYFNDLSCFNIFCIKIIKAIEFINTMKYVNGDIKPQNIVFDTIDNPYIIDFGVVANYENSNYKKKIENQNGSYVYMSTDAHEGIISQRTDLISFGFIIYEILEKKSLPWASICTNNNKFLKIKKLFVKNSKFYYYTNPIIVRYFNIVYSKNYNETPLYNDIYNIFTN